MVSDTVSLRLAQEVPLQVEFEILAPAEADKETGARPRLGYMKYYLAPKVNDGEDEQPEQNNDPADE